MGNWTFYGHNALWQKLFVTNVNNQVTQCEYSGTGLPESILDAAGRTSFFYYDCAGRMTNAVFPGNVQKSCSYNALGQQIQVTDGLGHWATNGYNHQGLPSVSGNFFGQTKGILYDIYDRPTNTLDANGITIVPDLR